MSFYVISEYFLITVQPRWFKLIRGAGYYQPGYVLEYVKGKVFFIH